MQLFTPWPNQQCQACSRNQCSKGVPHPKCCWLRMEYSSASNASCTANFDIAGSAVITQVVSPAATINKNGDISASSVARKRALAGTLAPNLHAALEESNGA